MVLHGILENLLHRACTARRIDDATIGEGEDAVLTDAVLEKLRNVCGKRSGRLMTIEPCRHTKAVECRLWEFLHHVESRCQPTLVLEGRRNGKHSESLPDFLFTPPRHPSTEMRGLHGPRPTAGEHAETLFGESLRQQHDFTEHLVGAQQCMTAHHPHAVPWVVVLEEFVERHMDAMVVQGSCKQLFYVFRLLALGYEMAVGPRVVTVGETVLVAGNETIIQLRRIIKSAARHLEWDSLKILHDLCQISLFAYCKHIFLGVKGELKRS